MSTSSASRYPRVLVVGQPFERTSGGGITLSNLFEGWPRDRLAAVAVSGENLSFDVCERQYVLGSDEITWVWPLSLVTRTETGPSRPDACEASRAAVSAHPSADPARGPVKRIFRAGVDALGVGDALRGMHLSAGLRTWIAAFQPDIVYSQLSDLPIMTLVNEILDETGLPFAFHVMDDWPESMYRSGALAAAVRGRARRVLLSLLDRASARMAIGDAMAAEYLRRYGLPFVPIQNSVDIARQDALASLHRADYEQATGPCLRLVYAGRVGRANASSLVDVAVAVSELAATGTPVCLQVYTATSGDPAIARMAGLGGVEVLGAVPYEHIPGLLAGADVLLMPLDFDADSVRFARLSMPTKIPEYMAAGRPVLTYAPRGCAAAEYARTGGWSVLVDERDPLRLRAALTSLAADAGVRAAMGAAGRRVAMIEHDATAVRVRFAAELTRAAGRS
jgi:glycosyltransferase involved in cell wall biosynthesis